MIPGRDFENEVARLLELAGYAVTREILLNYKKVDIFVLQRTLGGTRRIAVECKDHSDRLSQDEVTKIHVNYRPLIDSNAIDGILVVTRNGLSPSAAAMVQSSRELTHATSVDLYRQVMDFGPYLAGLTKQFDENGLSRYYVPPLDTDGIGFEVRILNWIASLDPRPLAILGSYGTGKTTLARRLASVLASKSVDDPGSRVPILVRLGEISSEQSLEGLLGKLFTAHTVVRNYTFDLFMSLNAAGRFVILLDGFDEMKHALTWSEFKYNFRQLNRLVAENGKVILLGRPTAFLNDSEYRLALRGIREIGGVELRDPEWPEYHEWHLEPFSEVQAREFLIGYLGFKLKITDDSAEREQIQGAISERIDRFFAGTSSDILRRPVQLKMLAEILPSWDRSTEELTVARLFDYFIDLIIERELEKLARQRFNVHQRRDFARGLAIFLWRTRGEMSITADRIPRDLIAKYANPEDDLEAVKRDLVAACFLDRKLGDSLFFPHRSFQEFLVAEAIVSELDDESGHSDRFAAASALATDEVVDFMEEMVSLETLERWQPRLERSRGTLTRRFAGLWLTRPESADYLWRRFENTKSPWYSMLLTLALKEGRPGVDRIVLKEALRERIGGRIGQLALAYFWCFLSLAEAEDLPDVLCALTTVARYNPGASSRAFVPEHSVVELFSRIQLEERKRGKHVATIGGLVSSLVDALGRYCLIADSAGVVSWEVPSVVHLDNDQFRTLGQYQFKWCGLPKPFSRR